MPYQAAWSSWPVEHGRSTDAKPIVIPALFQTTWQRLPSVLKLDGVPNDASASE
jgi:hypothetical protein